MPIYTLQRKQVLKAPIDRCWSFFSDPRNLPRITPPALRFCVKTVLPEQIYAGLMIEYTVCPLFGVPVSWLTEITQVQAPAYFADEQRVGPYAIWHHEHFFRDLGDGQTEVRDLVHYVPPLGPFGAVLNFLLVHPQLERIFGFREKTLRELFP